MALPKVAQDTATATAKAVGDASTAAAKGVADKVFDLTIKPLKSLFTPAGIGGVVAMGTKSPLLGALVSGSLNTAGKAVKGLGSIGGGLAQDNPLEEPVTENKMIDQLTVGRLVVAGEEQDPEEKNNDDLWDVLAEMLDVGEKQLEAEDRTRMEQERGELARLEAQRELSRMEQERIQLLDEILNNQQNPEEADKSGKGLLGWLAAALGLKAAAGGIKRLATSLFASLFGKKGIIRLALSRMVQTFATTLIPALGTILKKIIMSPITLLVGFYEGIKTGLQEKSVEGFVAGFFTGLINLVTQFFGVEKATIKNFMLDLVNAITDGIGQIILGVWKGFTALGNIKISDMFANAGTAMMDYLKDALANEVAEWKAIAEEYGIVQLFQDLASDIVELAGKIKDGITKALTVALDSIVGIVNSIPGVEIALTEEQRARNLQKRIDELEGRKQEIMAKETSEGFFGYSQQNKNDDLMELNMQLNDLKKARKMARGGIARSAVNAIVGEGADELVTPLHRLDDLVVNPAVSKTLALVRKQEETRNLQSDKGGSSSGSTVITPINNTLVQQKQATPFVTPISRRNNENTFQRIHDSLHNGKLI